MLKGFEPLANVTWRQACKLVINALSNNIRRSGKQSFDWYSVLQTQTSCHELALLYSSFLKGNLSFFSSFFLFRKKPCRHFDEGRGECPFNDSCFYKHALPDGTSAPPSKPRKRENADGELERVLSVSLWDFLAEDTLRREIRSQLEDDLEIINYLALSEILEDNFLLDSPGYHSSEDSD